MLVLARPPRKPTLKEKLRWKLLGKPLPAATVKSPSYFDKDRFPRDFDFRYLDELPPRDRRATFLTPTSSCATWWETAEWVAALPGQQGRQAYFVQHYETFAGDPARIDATYRLPMHKVCVAQWLVDLSREKFGDPTAEVVPNAVDLEQFTAPPRQKQPTPTVGVMYSTVDFKGCDISLKAYELAKKQIPELKLVASARSTRGRSCRCRRGPIFGSSRRRMRSGTTTRSATPGCSAAAAKASACRCWRRWPAGRRSSPRRPARPRSCAPRRRDPRPTGRPEAMADQIVRVARMNETDWRSMSDEAYATATGYTWDDAAARFEAALIKARELGKRQVAA